MHCNSALVSLRSRAFKCMYGEEEERMKMPLAERDRTYRTGQANGRLALKQHQCNRCSLQRSIVKKNVLK